MKRIEELEKQVDQLYEELQELKNKETFFDWEVVTDIDTVWIDNHSYPESAVEATIDFLEQLTSNINVGHYSVDYLLQELRKIEFEEDDLPF